MLQDKVHVTDSKGRLLFGKNLTLYPQQPSIVYTVSLQYFTNICLSSKGTLLTLIRPELSCGGKDRDAAVTLALACAKLPVQKERNSYCKNCSRSLEGKTLYGVKSVCTIVLKIADTTTLLPHPSHYQLCLQSIQHRHDRVQC